MKPVVPVGRSRGSAPPDEQAAWKLGFLCGLTLALVGALDAALLFYPARFASLDWEFGTISGLVEGMPLVTMGFGAMAAAAAATGWKKWSQFLGVAGLLIAVVLAVLLLIFALDLPAAFRALQPAARGPLRKSVLKTGLMGVAYFVFYATLGVWTWRRLKSLKGAS